MGIERPSMNKSDLTKRLAGTLELTLRDAEEAVNVIVGELRDALLRGERIEIRGFGAFTVREYKAYTGRNPRTGELIEVAPKRLPFFKVGKDFMGRLNGGGK